MGTAVCVLAASYTILLIFLCFRLMEFPLAVLDAGSRGFTRFTHHGAAAVIAVVAALDSAWEALQCSSQKDSAHSAALVVALARTACRLLSEASISVGAYCPVVSAGQTTPARVLFTRALKLPWSGLLTEPARPMHEAGEHRSVFSREDIDSARLCVAEDCFGTVRSAIQSAVHGSLLPGSCRCQAAVVLAHAAAHTCDVALLVCPPGCKAGLLQEASDAEKYLTRALLTEAQAGHRSEKEQLQAEAEFRQLQQLVNACAVAFAPSHTRIAPQPLILNSPSLFEFSAKAFNVGQPAVLKGCTNDWPALRCTCSFREEPEREAATVDHSSDCRSWRSLVHLLRVAGFHSVPVEVGRCYMDKGWSTRLLPFGPYLAHCIRVSASKQGVSLLSLSDASTGAVPTASAAVTSATSIPPLYLAQHQLFDQIPLLASDVIVPDYCSLSLARVADSEVTTPGLCLSGAQWSGTSSTTSTALLGKGCETAALELHHGDALPVRGCSALSVTGRGADTSEAPAAEPGTYDAFAAASAALAADSDGHTMHTVRADVSRRPRAKLQLPAPKRPRGISPEPQSFADEGSSSNGAASRLAPSPVSIAETGGHVATAVIRHHAAAAAAAHATAARGPGLIDSDATAPVATGEAAARGDCDAAADGGGTGNADFADADRAFTHVSRAMAMGSTAASVSADAAHAGVCSNTSSDMPWKQPGQATVTATSSHSRSGAGVTAGGKMGREYGEVPPAPPAVTVQAWIGPAGTVSRLHFDEPHNILAQVVGWKRILLYPPLRHELTPRRRGMLPTLHSTPAEVAGAVAGAGAGAVAGAGAGAGAGVGASASTFSSAARSEAWASASMYAHDAPMDNTSRVDVDAVLAAKSCAGLRMGGSAGGARAAADTAASPSPGPAVEFPAFPARPAFDVLLGPGDCLYIPPLWWHHVTACTLSYSVSFWW